jgi:hypothetical protein
VVVVGWFLGSQPVKVEAYRLWRRDVLGLVQAIAPVGVAVVEECFGRRLEPVRITLTTPDGLAELACRAEFQLVPQAPASQRGEALRQAKVKAREAAGHVLLNPRGRGTLMFLNCRSQAMRVTEGIVTTLAHELVHCDQFGRRGVREAIIAHTRRGLGVKPMDAQAVRSFEDQVAAHEDEAYGMEEALAARIMLAAGTLA